MKRKEYVLLITCIPNAKVKFSPVQVVLGEYVITDIKIVLGEKDVTPDLNFGVYDYILRLVKTWFEIYMIGGEKKANEIVLL